MTNKKNEENKGFWNIQSMSKIIGKIYRVQYPIVFVFVFLFF